MTTHRPAAHAASAGGPVTGGHAGDAASGDGFAESRVRDRLAVDAAAEWPTKGAPEPERERRASAAEAGPQEAGSRPALPRRPRHARDRDDPEGLAGWVGSLNEADDAVAHTGGGLPKRVPRGAVPQTPMGAPVPSDESPPGDAAQAPDLTRGRLIERLDALATLVRIGEASVEADLLERARGLLDHAGTRLRMSTDHTVVALAGGTGSGKSSLFNAICRLDLSAVGITRPTTSDPHACVWGTRGARQLLDWLEIPERFRHSRTSELDPGEDDLVGLILVDSPDHDSVRTGHAEHARRLLGAADLMIWVLDPQKYADAAIHHRYLADLVGHRTVMVTVLNQVDRLDEREAEDCLSDLRRLLDDGEGAHPRILTTSTLTEVGVAELRALLAETVADRRASIERLAADLDGVVERFAPYAEPGEHDRPAWEAVGSGLAGHAQETLYGYIAAASGVTAVAQAVETEYERHGAQRVAWPIARAVGRLRRDPLHAIRADFESARSGIEGSVGVQWPEVESAIDEAAASAGEGLPDGWPARVRTAAKAHSERLVEMLGSAVAGAIPAPGTVPAWWAWVRALQYLFLGSTVLGAAWAVGSAVSIFGEVELLPWMDNPLSALLAVLVVVGSLLLGLLLSLGSRNIIGIAAGRLRESVEETGRGRVRTVVDDHILAPLHNELVEYQRFTAALRTARG